MAKQIPEKCRLCAKLTAVQAKLIHGVDGDGCWNSAVCPSRQGKRTLIYTNRLRGTLE